MSHPQERGETHHQLVQLSCHSQFPQKIGRQTRFSWYVMQQLQRLASVVSLFFPLQDEVRATGHLSQTRCTQSMDPAQPGRPSLS